MNINKFFHFNNVKTKKWIFFGIISVLTLIFFLLCISFKGGYFHFGININDKYNLIFLTLSVFLAFFAIGFSSTGIQYSTRNILGSPIAIGIYPAASFSFLLAYAKGFTSNIYERFGINIAFTLIIMIMYLLIDFKVGQKTKIVFFFIISLTLSAVSLILFTKYGIQKEATLLFSISKLNMSLNKLVLGIGPIIAGLILILVFKKKISLYYFEPLRAKSMGVKIKLMKVNVLFGAILAINGALIMFGAVSFIGLVIPNAIRLIGIEKFSENFIASALLSGLIGVCSYFASRVIKIDMFLMLIIFIIPWVIPIIIRMKRAGSYD